MRKYGPVSNGKYGIADVVATDSTEVLNLLARFVQKYRPDSNDEYGSTDLGHM